MRCSGRAWSTGTSEAKKRLDARLSIVEQGKQGCVCRAMQVCPCWLAGLLVVSLRRSFFFSRGRVKKVGALDCSCPALARFAWTCPVSVWFRPARCLCGLEAIPRFSRKDPTTTGGSEEEGASVGNSSPVRGKRDPQTLTLSK